MTHANRVPHGASQTPVVLGAAKRHALLRQALLALSLGFAAWPGLADDDCDVPVQQWQSREAVRQMAAARGWQVQRIKIDDGCYEIHGIDAQGLAFKAKLDPQTLDIIKLKHKDHDGKHAREPAAAQPDASSADTPPPASEPAAPPCDPIDS